jgi:hypothetical protein
MNNPPYNFITAQEAYDLSMKKHDEIEVSQEIEDLAARIKEVAELGSLATFSKPMDVLKAEKVAIYFSDMAGFACHTQQANMIANSIPQAYVMVNWRFVPANSRERLTK